MLLRCVTLARRRLRGKETHSLYFGNSNNSQILPTPPGTYDQMFSRGGTSSSGIGMPTFLYPVNANPASSSSSNLAKTFPSTPPISNAVPIQAPSSLSSNQGVMSNSNLNANVSRGSGSQSPSSVLQLHPAPLPSSFLGSSSNNLNSTANPHPNAIGNQQHER